MDIITDVFIAFFLASVQGIGKCYIYVARFFVTCDKEQLTAFASAVIEKQAERGEWYYSIAEEHLGDEFVAYFLVQRALIEDLLKVFNESNLSYGTKISAEFQKYWVELCSKTVQQAKEICFVAEAK